MINKQTQQIMQLLETQVKYGLHVVAAEDEIQDINLEETVEIQDHLE